MVIHIQLRRGTGSEWTTSNPILAAGEIGLETDASPVRFKVGDGILHWSDLAYGFRGDAGATGATGPQGEKGDRGETGLRGETGADGLDGTDGITYDWLTGDGVPSSGLGKNGDMYLAEDTADVYRKESGSWAIKTNILGLQGPQGLKGDTGSTGPQGLKGDKGDTGATGATGDAGPRGDTGPQGAKGDKGDTGESDPAFVMAMAIALGG